MGLNGRMFGGGLMVVGALCLVGGGAVGMLVAGEPETIIVPGPAAPATRKVVRFPAAPASVPATMTASVAATMTASGPATAAGAMASTGPAGGAATGAATMAGKVKKLALPGGAELAEAMKLVEEVYKGDIAIARMQGQKENLARKMRADASGEQNLTARYAVWLRSKELAVEAGDVGTVQGLMEEMDRTFEIDAVKMAVDCSGKLFNALHTPGEKRGMAAFAKAYAEKALREENYEAAKMLAEKGLAAARMLGEAEAVKEAAGVREEVVEGELALAGAKKGLAVLAEKPEDGEANLKVGSYLCFYRGNWKEGLAKLSKGSDKGLAELAKLDAGAGGAGVEERMKVADAWWEAGLKAGGTVRHAMEDRACRYYAALLPELGGGLAKLKAERRIEEAEWVPEAGSVPAAPAFVMQLLNKLPKEFLPVKEDGPRETMEKGRQINDWVAANPAISKDGARVNYATKLGAVDVNGKAKPTLAVQWEQGFDFNGVAVKVLLVKHREAPLGKDDPEYVELLAQKKERPEGVFVVTGKVTGLSLSLRRARPGADGVAAVSLEVRMTGDGVVGRVAE